MWGSECDFNSAGESEVFCHVHQLAANTVTENCSLFWQMNSFETFSATLNNSCQIGLADLWASFTLDVHVAVTQPCRLSLNQQLLKTLSLLWNELFIDSNATCEHLLNSPSVSFQPTQTCILFLKILFIYLFVCLLFLAMLGLCCCPRAFFSCGEQGLLFVVACGLLIAVASLVAEHGL